MESASPMQIMPSGKKLRRGQAEVVALITNQARVVAKLPTGYGKTLTAAAAYANLRSMGIVNRLLWIVPRLQQQEQGAEDVPGDLRDEFGVDAKSWTIGDHDIATLRAHLENQAVVFVIIVHRLNYTRGMNTVLELLSSGQWMIVIDEHHHYASDDSGSVWTDSVVRLKCNRLLAMSATPHRRDDKTKFGAFGKPDVSVSYVDALTKEEAVKPLDLHAYDYRAEFVTVNGRRVSFTTAQLLAEVPDGNIDKFAASRQMRWFVDYVSPLILMPAGRIADQRVDGVKSQMLVIALSVEHAKIVCEQIRTLLPALKVDWCGTGDHGRSDDENRSVLERFCPAKNRLTGKREWKLDVLVTCNMAGEGLDSIDVTEIVFLTCPQINNTTLQAIGRGARVMSTKPQPTCFVNVDCSSPLADYIGGDVMELFDELPSVSAPRAPPSPPAGEPPYVPMPPFTLEVTKVELLDVKKHPAYWPTFNTIRAQTPTDQWSDEKLHGALAEEIEKWHAKVSQPLNETSVIAVKTDDIKNRLGKLGFLCAKTYAQQSGLAFNKTWIGAFCERINTAKLRQCGSIKTVVSARELVAHANFLSELEAEILSNGVPQWL